MASADHQHPQPGGTHTDERIAEPIRQLHRRQAPEVGDWDFPTAKEIQQRALVGGDIASVWARVERKLSEPPAVSHLFGPPTIKTYPRLATYDKDAYLAMLASQSSYALMDPVRCLRTARRYRGVHRRTVGGHGNQGVRHRLGHSRAGVRVRSDLRIAS